MALQPKLAVASANAAADAVARHLDNGFLRIYDGTKATNADTAVGAQVLLAELRFAATSAPAASGGVITCSTIPADLSADATGTATWFRALKSDGTSAVLDGTCGVGTFDLVFDTTSIQSGGRVDVASLLIRFARPDTTAPVISAVAATNTRYENAVDGANVTVTWTTDEASTSQVEYGLTGSYGAVTTVDPTLVTSHSVVIPNLTAETLYHYRVLSADASGNPSTGSDNTITTEWSPAVLGIGTAVVLWIDPTLETAFVDGNAIQNVTDWAGYAPDFHQYTGSNKPLYDTEAFDTVPGFDFLGGGGGSNSWFVALTEAVPHLSLVATNYFISTVIKTTQADSGLLDFQAAASPFQGWILRMDTGTPGIMTDGLGTFLQWSGARTDDGNPHLVEVEGTNVGETITISVDGTAGDTAASAEITAVSPDSQVSIGAGHTGSGFFLGKMGPVLIVNRALTAGEKTKWRAFVG